MQPKLYLILIFALFLTPAGWAQDNLTPIDKVINFPSSFFSKVNSKTVNLEARVSTFFHAIDVGFFELSTGATHPAG